MSRAHRLSATQPAFVLHAYDWSESSLILELFTRDLGRIAVMAKGAKRPYSQLRAVLLPFQRIQISLTKGAAKATSADAPAPEVQTLRTAEWVGGQTLPVGAALFSGYHLNELLLKFLPRQEAHPALFEVYAATLPQLHEREDSSSEAALRAFELRLLSELGLLPDLSLDTQTQQALQADRPYLLSAETGLSAITSHGGSAATLNGRDWVQVQAALLHGAPAALQQACAAHLPALKASLRGLFHYHLGSQGLRTRQVVMDLQKLLDGRP